jgi:hypothetical protein
MWGSWDDPRARATRGLRRMRGSRQTVLLARKAPTIKRWSLDARSEEQSAYFLWGSWGSEGPRPDKWHVSARQGWAGEKSGHFEHPAGYSDTVPMPNITTGIAQKPSFSAVC